MNRLRNELDRLEERYFVGREQELSKFADFMREDATDIRIINIYGTAGMGKSTLLDRFRRIAIETGNVFILADSRDFQHSPGGFARFLVQWFEEKQHREAEDDSSEERLLQKAVGLLNGAAQEKQIVLAFDTFEEMGDMEYWIREALFPMLDARVKCIIAGRHSLKGAWVSSHSWRQIIYRMPLGQLRPEAVKQYLQKQGFDEEEVMEKLVHRTIGHPLTLSLAAYYYKSGIGGKKLDIVDESELTGTLAEFWFKEVPESLRGAIEAASILRSFNYDTLTFMLDQPLERSAFDQLVNLSFVRLTSRGWMFHDLMRDTVIRQLRLQSPMRYKQLQGKAIRYYFRNIIGSARRDEMGLDMSELFFYLGDAMVRAFMRNAEPETYKIEPLDENNIAEAEIYLEWRRATAKALKLTLLDPDSGEEVDFSISKEGDLSGIQRVDFQELLQLDRDIVKLFRSDDGKIAGFSAYIPIHSGTLDYLLAKPYSRAYFRSLSEEQLEAMRVPKPEAVGWFIRSVDMRVPHDPQAIFNGFQALFRLALKGGLIVASPPPQQVYQGAHIGLGYDIVPNVYHCDYDDRTPTPTFVLDTRGARLEGYLRKLIGRLALEEPPMSLSSTKLQLLSAREREVVQLVAEGLRNAEIGDRLFVSEITIKKHLTSIYQKLQIKNRAELVKTLLER
ncbi:LuxR family transcriptional regulator [Paenibacillus sp.]|uniref:LuxR family transcriptional regulator n=1 Tax=Paenibacillus sp. TaxID=58172 RepID=UPI002D52E000|nr:LuxR family transcriptional regulator [Paenibacillus sp.]HZG88166.1 LuxR family transcriptional regulator [Paenibacillus sp.]